MKSIGKIRVVVGRFFYFGVFAFLFVSPASKAGDLIVVVENCKSDQGNVRVALFDSAKEFPKKSAEGQSITATTGAMSFVFKDLPNGKYAVSAFHDINANNKLDTNFVGKPVEPYGFSRDARGTFGPPSFDDASFQIDDQARTINFSVK